MHTFRSTETTSSNSLSDIPVDPWSTQSTKPATSDNHKFFDCFILCRWIQQTNNANKTFGFIT